MKEEKAYDKYYYMELVEKKDKQIAELKLVENAFNRLPLELREAYLKDAKQALK